MTSCKSIYEPREDSELLEKYVRQYAKGDVLDVGTGSGIQAIAAAQCGKVSHVIATDVQKGVISYCKENIKNKKITFLHSDLFENVRGSFDTIIFNPPYLPAEGNFNDITIEGGRFGHEVIEKFIGEVNKHLKSNGIILMAFSSLTNKSKIEAIIKDRLLDFKELGKIHFFFEDIYSCILRKSDLLEELESKGVSEIRYLAKGHRGLVFRGVYKKKDVIIKTKNPSSTATGRISNEAKWLLRLNRHGIGPKLVFYGGDSPEYFIAEFIEGENILEYLKKSGRKDIQLIIKKIFIQLLALDKLKIDKEEMHRPLKHIIVKRKTPCLVDFERAHYSPKPKNVTQFCQFVTGNRLSELFKSKGIFADKKKAIKFAKSYKNPNMKKYQKMKFLDIFST